MDVRELIDLYLVGILNYSGQANGSKASEHETKGQGIIHGGRMADLATCPRRTIRRTRHVTVEYARNFQSMIEKRWRSRPWLLAADSEIEIAERTMKCRALTSKRPERIAHREQ